MTDGKQQQDGAAGRPQPPRTPQDYLALVVALAMGGAGGSVVTAQGVQAELRETRAVFVGRFDKLEARYDSQDSRLARIEHAQTKQEERLRELEHERASRSPR